MERTYPHSPTINLSKCFFGELNVNLLTQRAQSMKKRELDVNLFMKIIIIIFIAEQVLFMAYVIYKKGTAILDYIANLF